jgi:hypothetical protein
VIDYRAAGVSPCFGNYVMALELYADESIRSVDGDLVVAGFAAHINTWAQFATRWKERLDRDGISHFHTHKFRNGKSSLFASLPKPKRDQLFKDLLELIRGHALVGVSCTINQKEYKSMTSAEYRGRYGSAYGLAVGACFYQASQFFKDVHATEELSVFIEDGHQHSRGAVDLMLYAKQQMLTVSKPDDPAFEIEPAGDREIVRVRNFTSPYGGFLQIGSVGAGSKISMRPLQAADILAYCTLNQAGEFSKGVIESIRQSVPIISKSVNQEDIQAFIDGVTQDEQHRSETRRMMHEMSRTLGLLGIKMRNVPTGVQIDLSGAHDIKSLELQLPLKGVPRVAWEFGSDTKESE